MSIASPRPSINLPSSRRTSTSTITSTRSPSSSRPASIRDINTATSTTHPPPTQTRRNRAALREFYNLQNNDAAATPPAPASTNGPPPHDADPLAALDAPSFSSSTYVSSLLETSTTETLLGTLNAITISSLGLEGDKKALVYDNYTTLLSATSTIAGLRRDVEPMAPVTTLEPAVKHIADTVKGVKESRRRDKEGEREVVRWVLGAPGRLRDLLGEGKRKEAEAEWVQVRRLLTKWEGVGGVKEVREECEGIMKEGA